MPKALDSMLESMACGTPIICTMTGGMQDQVTDGENWFGIGLEPSSKAIIGSQDIPWIYEDRLNGKDVVDAMLKMYNMTPEERKELGLKALENVNNRFSFKLYEDRWVKLINDVIEEHGSWDNRKNYNRWEIEGNTMTKKARILVRGPALSASGYGEHCRFLIRSLLKNPLCDLYVDNIKWGNLGFDLSVYDEIPELKDIINHTKQLVLPSRHFSIFPYKLLSQTNSKKSPLTIVGVTAGIEVDRVAKEWIEKCNEMDKIITISEHSKNTLEQTVYQVEQGILKLNTPVSVVPYPVLKTAESTIDLKLETDFNFLIFSLLGARKNIESTIGWFVEEFKDEEVGLVLKTAFINGTIKDRRRVEQHIKRNCRCCAW